MEELKDCVCVRKRCGIKIGTAEMMFSLAIISCCIHKFGAALCVPLYFEIALSRREIQYRGEARCYYNYTRQYAGERCIV